MLARAAGFIGARRTPSITRTAFGASTDGPDYPIVTEKGPLNELSSARHPAARCFAAEALSACANGVKRACCGGLPGRVIDSTAFVSGADAYLQLPAVRGGHCIERRFVVAERRTRAHQQSGKQGRGEALFHDGFLFRR